MLSLHLILRSSGKITKPYFKQLIWLC
jgi:hypothetical protein